MTDLTMPAVGAGPRRIVLEYTTGPLKGLRQILGTDDQVGPGLPPPFVEALAFKDGHVNGASLLRSTSRFHLYRELVTPETCNLETFDPHQQ